MNVSEDYNLKVINPKLAKQWHPAKNGNLTPEMVTPGSGKKVWWICDKGHEWKAPIEARNKGRGCPYCCGRRVCKDNCLSTRFPDLVGQWHPTKNGNLTPDMVTPGFSKKVWWVCDKGHEWKTAVAARHSGKGCPYCSGKKVCKDNCLSTRYPGLAGQWHPTKNGNLTPAMVTPGCAKKVWWVCDKGHEWEANIGNRIKGQGCPYCAGQRASKEYNLLVCHPDLARQWHPFKNGELTPDQVTPGSIKKVWWLCDKGHEWKATVGSRNNGNGCPYCAGRFASKEYNFKTLHPDIAGQWHPWKNGELTPDQVTPGSHKKVWWICDKGHEWMSIIGNRSKGIGCPYCTGVKKIKVTEEYNLFTVRPELAKQWHPFKNEDILPEEVGPDADLTVWWRCEKGHEWTAVVSERTQGSGCPICLHSPKT